MAQIRLASERLPAALGWWLETDTRENMQVQQSKRSLGGNVENAAWYRSKQTCRHIDLFYCLLFSQSRSKKSRLMSQPSKPRSKRDQSCTLLSWALWMINIVAITDWLTDCMTDDMVTSMMHDSLPDKLLSNCMTGLHVTDDRGLITWRGLHDSLESSRSLQLGQTQTGPHSSNRLT